MPNQHISKAPEAGLKTVYLFPHFHYDSEWLRTREGYLQTTLDNVVNALQFCSIDPDFRYCFDQVSYLEPLLERMPELKGELLRAIDCGQVEIICGMYTQPQPNFPSGEFLVRNCCVGKRWTSANLGVDVTVGWMIDTYGLPRQLPQILAKSGIKSVAFFRGVPHDMPGVFLWKGLDGTDTIVHWMNHGYAGPWPLSRGTAAMRQLEGCLPEWEEQAVDGVIGIAYGGDHVPPQRSLPEVIGEWNQSGRSPRIVISKPSDFLGLFRDRPDKLETYDGELEPIHQGVGAARSWVKQWVHKLENLYLEAEKLATMASLVGESYPDGTLEDCLKQILLCQFHDIFLAECIDEVYKKVDQRLREAERQLDAIVGTATRFLVERISTGQAGIPLVVLNTLSWPRTDTVSAEVYFAEKGADGIHVVGADGRPVLLQVVKREFHEDGSLKMVHVVFAADDVPPMGYRLFYVMPGEEEATAPEPAALHWGEGYSDPCILENQWFRVELDGESKAVKSIYDKVEKREILDAREYLGNTLVAQPDYGTATRVQGDYGGQTIEQYVDELPPAQGAMTTLNFRGSIIETEGGPVRSRVKILTMLGPSKVTQEICLCHQARRIDFHTHLRFAGPENYRVRMVMPTNIEGGRIWNEIPYGAVERGEGLHIAQNWVDYGTAEYGIGLLNKGIPSNNVAGGNMALTLLRSISKVYLRLGVETEKPGEWEMHYRLRVGLEDRNMVVPDALEIGREFDFDYSLYPHAGDWRDGKTYRASMEFQNPLRVVKAPVSRLDKTMSEAWGLVKVEPDNLILTVCKKGEEDGTIVLRFFEAAGRHTQGKVKFARPLKRAWLANLLEESEEELRTTDRDIEIEVRPFEIATLKVALSPI